MTEIKLRWNTKLVKRKWQTKSGEMSKEYWLYRILIHSILARSLIKLIPCWDLKSNEIVFKSEQECKDGDLVRLRWTRRREHNGRTDKEFIMYYVAVPDTILLENNLLEQVPYLDIENKVIRFKPKEQVEQSILYSKDSKEEEE